MPKVKPVLPDAVQEWPVAKIPLELIDVPAGYSGPSHTSGRLAWMVESLQMEGLLEPIGVRPVVDGLLEIGRYELLWGWLRRRAAEQLQWQEIEARILVLDDARSREVHIAENLVRSELTRADRAILLKEWKALHEIRRPRPVPGLPAGNGATGAGLGAGRVPKAADDSPEAPAPTFAAQAAATTGLGQSTVYRNLRISANLSDPDLRMMDDRNVGDHEIIDFLNDCPTPGEREEVLKRFRKGTGLAEAVADVLGEWEGKVPQTPAATPAAPPAPSAAGTPSREVPPPPEPQDNQKAFLGSLREPDCYGNPALATVLLGVRGEIREYEQQALLYFKLEDARRDFHRRVLPLTKKSGLILPGCYADIVLRFLYTRHPKQWVLCPHCEGRGCSRCYEGGFRVIDRDKDDRALQGENT